jgi:hypothetical protein
MRISRKLICYVPLLAAFTMGGLAVTTPAQETEATTAAPGIFPAFITAGALDPYGRVPAFDAVPGSGVTNLDLSVPLTVLEHGKYYAYTLALQDNDYTGTYAIAYKLTQVVKGKTVTLESGTIVSDKKTEPGNVWAWTTIGKAIPDSPGQATLEGVITYDGKTATVSTQVLIK